MSDRAVTDICITVIVCVYLALTFSLFRSKK